MVPLGINKENSVALGFLVLFRSCSDPLLPYLIRFKMDLNYDNLHYRALLSKTDIGLTLSAKLEEVFRTCLAPSCVGTECDVKVLLGWVWLID